MGWGSNWCWKWSWRTNLFDREMNSVSQFLDVVNRYNLKQGEQDSHIWKPKSVWRYSTSSTYEIMPNLSKSGDNFNTNGEAFKLVWNKITPLKVSVMMWRLLWDRLPAKINLLKEKNFDFGGGRKILLLCYPWWRCYTHIFYARRSMRYGGDATYGWEFLFLYITLFWRIFCCTLYF